MAEKLAQTRDQGYARRMEDRRFSPVWTFPAWASLLLVSLLFVCSLAFASTAAAQVNPDPRCSDNLDNDGDGRTDFRNGSNDPNPMIGGDFGCTSDLDNSEAPNPECSDGIDNDADGKIDGFDQSCYSPDFNPRDNSELVPQQCSDGVDSDNDGHIDHPADPGCASRSDDSESPDDDDGDGLVDRNDACPIRSATTANGCPNISRSLTLGFSAGAFRGKLRADGATVEAACRRAQTVSVWRKVGPIGGANDVRLAADATDRTGTYVVPRQRRAGSYYSKVDRRTISTAGNCLAARSAVLKLG
jgi:hypothetical protein